MKNLVAICAVVLMVLAVSGVAFADYSETYDFETAWTGDYAPGWANSDYRHGDGPLTKMAQVDLTAMGRTGFGAKIYVESVAADSQFWGIIDATDALANSMDKQYDPWIKADFYDDGRDAVGGQLYAVPSLVTGEADWTDLQFGVRRNTELADYYYYIEHPENVWKDTQVARTVGWHEMKMQLSSTTGKVRFYIDGAKVGETTRSDYTDLGSLSLATMFLPPLTNWGTEAYSVWDNAAFGSTVPEPATMALLGLGGLLLARKKK